jgi:LuxR family maltose regulon positive regulatory protein
MTEADLALAEGDPGRAAQLGREWVTRCKDSAQVLSTTVLRIRTAIALVQCGDIEGARSFARTALTDATENAMNRVFLDEGPAALRLFDLCGDAGNLAAGQRAFVERCRRSSSLAGSMSADMPVLPPDATKLLGPNCLSPRELDVVRLLGRALSTKTIARTLDVSAGTVKWHLKNVFGKLNAVSREDAVNKARQLGLVA